MDFLHRTWAEINIPALIHNLGLIKKQCEGAHIMAVVKADAYGHSAKAIAPVLEREGADSFAVSNIDEALALREYGIQKPILILGYTPAECAYVLAKNNITQTVYSAEYAKKLSSFASKVDATVNVHIKLDTGMGRLGFDVRREDSEGLNEALAVFTLSNIKVTGTFTHFPVADSSGAEAESYTKAQLDRFMAAIQKIKAAGFNAGMLHCSNSAGVILGGSFKLDICRPGIILYGLSPSNEVKFDGIIPVMTVKSVVSMVKTIHKGEALSYGRTFKAPKEMKIATVTAGYADGYPRLLSNKGEVIIDGKRAPIVGRICMDQFIADVTDIENVAEGDEVLLFGAELPVEEIAEKCSTINYEIICGVSPRVPRVIIK